MQCFRCKSAIPKGAIRVGKQHDPNHSGYRYYHLKCLKSVPKDIEAENLFFGFEDLRLADQQKVRNHCAQIHRNPEKLHTKKATTLKSEPSIKKQEIAYEATSSKACDTMGAQSLQKKAPAQTKGQTSWEGRIFILTVTAGEIEIPSTSLTSIRNLKQALARKYPHLTMEKMTLKWNQCELEDDRLLCQYGIPNEAVLFLELRLTPSLAIPKPVCSSTVKESSRSRSSFKIFVSSPIKVLSSSAVSFHATVCDSTTVLSLKQQIQGIQKCSANQQRLIFAGKELEDDKTMKDYGITEGSNLSLALRCQHSAPPSKPVVPQFSSVKCTTPSWSSLPPTSNESVEDIFLPPNTSSMSIFQAPGSPQISTFNVNLEPTEELRCRLTADTYCWIQNIHQNSPQSAVTVYEGALEKYTIDADLDDFVETVQLLYLVARQTC